MIRTKGLVLLTLSIISFSSAKAQVSSPDAMVNKIFATLKAKDEKAFIALYPNGIQFSRFMRTIMEQSLNSEQMKEMMQKDEKAKNLNLDSLINEQVNRFADPKMFAEMEKGFVKTFQKIIEKGEKKGVKWSDATLTGYTIDTTAEVDEDMAAMGASGLRTMKGVMDFSVGSTPYHLAFDKVIYLPMENGWFGAEFKQLALKGESLQPDKMMEEDEAAAMVDSAVAVESPKAKTKTKSKTPTVKTKTKVKTPARKTKS